MKILFAAGDLEKQLHAVNKIILQLAQSLSHRGNQCIVAGICTFDDAFCETKDGVKMVYLNSHHICDKAYLALENYIKQTGLDRESAKKKFYLAHPIYTASLLYRYNFSKKSLFCAKSYAKQIKQLADKEKPDAIVISYMPFEQQYQLVTNYSFSCPLIAYQLDPWGLHRGDNMTPSAHQHIQQETAVFEKCTKIVTTPVLLRQYSQHPDYQKYLDKMVPLNFPNVKPLPAFDKADCVFDFDQSTLNLLFCGIVHDEYRSPQFLLDSLKTVRENGFTNFKVHFLGTNESDSLKNFMAENDWVCHHSNVPLDKAFATMAQSDVLINIGNTYDNQVPSKIFDYFAFGKPVLNVEKISNCPAREYFDRYPLSFTLSEWQNQPESATRQLAQFLQQNKGKTLDFNQVEKLFSDCTSTYATDVFCDIINKI